MNWSATAARSRRTISKRVERDSHRCVRRRQQIGNILQVFVRDNNVDQALRALKKKMQREGIFREMKRRKAYEKPPSARPGRRRRPSDARARLPGNRRSAKA